MTSEEPCGVPDCDVCRAKLSAAAAAAAHAIDLRFVRGLRRIERELGVGINGYARVAVARGDGGFKISQLDPQATPISFPETTARSLGCPCIFCVQRERGDHTELACFRADYCDVPGCRICGAQTDRLIAACAPDLSVGREPGRRSSLVEFARMIQAPAVVGPVPKGWVGS